MVRVVNFVYLLRFVAVITTGLSILAYIIAEKLLQSELHIVRLFTVAPWVVLIVVLGLTTNPFSRFIWKLLRYFFSSLYPDLNGSWEGEIIPVIGKRIPAKAIIRQNLLETQIDLHTRTSKSATLDTTPVIEAGQFKLYYTYRSTPSNVEWPSYIGSTILDVRNSAKKSKGRLELSGYYFTDRKTNGRISLRQISSVSNTDVSFY